MDLLAHLACCLHVTHHASGADKLLDDQLRMTDNNMDRQCVTRCSNPDGNIKHYAEAHKQTDVHVMHKE